jgi:porin
MADANSDPTDPFNNLLNDSDFYKWVEVGFVPSQDLIYIENLHLTFWHIDERANGTPDGWGFNASWQRWIDEKWLPFIRGGYTEDSGSLLDRSASIGVGYQPVPRRGVIGGALNWGRPNETSFGDVDDQFTTELFWRYQLTKELAVTPTVQYIRSPALNPDTDNLWTFGLRIRLAL